MRLGLLAGVGWPGRDEEIAGLARLADAAAQGYDAVWLEDSASGAGITAPLLMAAARLAGAEGAAGIGLCAHASASIHPLRVAEELAVLDIMTGGRLEWAVDAQDADWELLEIVLRAWRGEPFAHAGPGHAFAELTCHPVPQSDPHPLLWMVDGTDVPGSVPLERQGRIAGTRARRSRLVAEAAERDGPLALARLVVVAERDADARARADLLLASLFEAPPPAGVERSEWIVAGDVERCADELARLREEVRPELLVVVADPGAASEAERAALQRAAATAAARAGRP